jgi:hypothetical protein
MIIASLSVLFFLTKIQPIQISAAKNEEKEQMIRDHTL